MTSINSIFEYTSPLSESYSDANDNSCSLLVRDFLKIAKEHVAVDLIIKSWPSRESGQIADRQIIQLWQQGTSLRPSFISLAAVAHNERGDGGSNCHFGEVWYGKPAPVFSHVNCDRPCLTLQWYEDYRDTIQLARTKMALDESCQ